MEHNNQIKKELVDQVVKKNIGKKPPHRKQKNEDDNFSSTNITNLI
jgi:hypothetical protein